VLLTLAAEILEQKHEPGPFMGTTSTAAVI
jgi:hypothetical protein